MARPIHDDISAPPPQSQRPRVGRILLITLAVAVLSTAQACTRDAPAPSAAPAASPAVTTAIVTPPENAASVSSVAPEPAPVAAANDPREARRKAMEAAIAALPRAEAGDHLTGLAPEDITRELVTAGRSPGERRFEGADQLIRRIRHVAANRNLAGLERYMTPKLIASTRAMMPTHAERFWTHLGRYVQAGEHGFGLARKAGTEEGSIELVVTVDADTVLRPIVVRGPAGLAFDRF